MQKKSKNAVLLLLVLLVVQLALLLYLCSKQFEGQSTSLIDFTIVIDAGHGGSDQSFLDEFISCISKNQPPQADYMAGLASTVIGNAIEKARLTNQVIEIADSEYQL